MNQNTDTTAVDAAAAFDVNAWLTGLKTKGMKPANVTVRMHYRSDLLPRLASLIQDIESLEKSSPDREIGVDEEDPLQVAVAEYNTLQQEFEAGGWEEFSFRPRNRRINDSTFAEWQDSGGEATDKDRECLVKMRMAATCVSHPGITVEALDAFEDEYGDAAFQTLVVAFLQAYTAGGEPEAPFSPKSLPTLTTDG